MFKNKRKNVHLFDEEFHFSVFDVLSFTKDLLSKRPIAMQKTLFFFAENLQPSCIE